MKAIVLSCDRYHPFAEHMMLSYRFAWPSHPFTFRIPFQALPHDLESKFGSDIELIQTPVHIKQTVLTLISDLPDDEWVYWCIDDKYPITIDEDAANSCYRWLNEVTDPSVCGFMFCRCRKLLDKANLFTEDTLNMPQGYKFIRRRNHYQIWIPQFVRVKFLRNLFAEFPDRPFRAKEMDTFTGQIPGMDVNRFERQQKLYVSANNYACFGESTIGGMVTKNCLESMKKRGIALNGVKAIKHSVLIGKPLKADWQC